MIKKLVWLIKHQKEIEDLLSKSKKTTDEKDQKYSLAGVPKYQREYINEILSNEDKG